MENKCPSCHSTNIRNDSIRNNNGIIGPGCRSWVVEEKYSCNDCGVYFKPVTERYLNLAIAGHGKPERVPAGPRWVKASEFKYEMSVTYHAYIGVTKGAGWFDTVEGDDIFNWSDGGDTLQCQFKDLYILDEQPAAAREEDIAEQDRKDGKELSAHYAHIEACEKKEAVAFSNWTLSSGCDTYTCTDEDQWTNIHTQENITTAELYDIFKKENP